MKNIFKSLLLISLLIACSKNDDFLDDMSNQETVYPHLQQVGYSAKDILSNTFNSIHVEVMYVNGFNPSAQALNNLQNFIEQRTYKKNIIIEKRLISIPTKSSYTLDDVKSIEDNNRSKFSSKDQIAISVLFLNGGSSDNSGNSIVLGTAYRNTSFVIYEESIHSLSDSPFEPSRFVLESTVLLHEFCHLLGLVNIGSSTVNNHQDSTHGAHCITQSCLMYYAIENGNSMLDHVTGDKIPQLDSFCILDLKANGGK